MFEYSYCMLLQVTTLFHLVALKFPSHCLEQDPYPWILLSGTTLSFIWHMTEEQVALIGILDYIAALIWALTDILYAYMYHNWTTVLQVVYLNMAIASIHWIHEFARMNRDAYVLHHSLWHLLSATKCVAVALLLQC